MDNLVVGLTLDRFLCLSKGEILTSPERVIEELKDLAVSRQITLKGRSAIISFIHETLNDTKILNGFVEHSLQESNRPKNESIIDFMEFMVHVCLVYIEVLLTSGNGDIVNQTRECIQRCEMLIGGGPKISRILFPDESFMLPLLTESQALSIVHEWLESMIPNQSQQTLTIISTQIVLLNAYFNLAISSTYTGDVAPIDNLQKASACIQAVKHKTNVDLATAALDIAEGDFAKAYRTLQNVRKRKAPIDEIQGVCALFIGDKEQFLKSSKRYKIFADGSSVERSKIICNQTQLDPAHLLVVADECVKIKDYARARSVLESVERYVHQNKPSHQTFLLAELFYQKGRLNHINKSYDAAMDDYSAAISNNPSHYAARFGLVKCHAACGRVLATRANCVALTRKCEFAMRLTNFALAVEEITGLNQGRPPISRHTEIAELIKNNPADDRNMLQLRRELTALDALASTGFVTCAGDALKTLRKILILAAKSVDYHRPDDDGKSSRLASDSGVSPEEIDERNMLKACLKGHCVPLQYILQYSILQMSVGKGKEACRTLSSLKVYIKALAPSLQALPQSLTESIELNQLTALCVAGCFDEFHAKLKRIGLETGAVSKTRDFGILRSLSYFLQGNLGVCRQLAEKELSYVYHQLLASGGRDMNVWEYYSQALELCFLSRSGVSQDPFRDKTKELLDRLIKKDSRRLSDDPTAVAMPIALKSRIVTLSAQLLMRCAYKRKLQEHRARSRSQSEMKQSKYTSERLYNEARDMAKAAVNLDTGNWRALYIIGKACRELGRPGIASKIFRLISDKVHPNIHPLDRALLNAVLVQESAFSLASTPKPPHTHAAKLQKGMEAALEQLGTNNKSRFLIEISECVIDPSLGRVICPFIQELVSKAKHPRLIERYALARVRLLSIIGQTQKSENLRDLHILRNMIQETQVVIELYRSLLREKIAAKNMWIARDPNGVELSRPAVFPAGTFAPNEILNDDFPISGSLRPWPERRNKVASEHDPHPVWISELERLPRDEEIKKKLEKDLLPILKKMRDIEPLLGEELVREEQQKQQMRIQNDLQRDAMEAEREKRLQEVIISNCVELIRKKKASSQRAQEAALGESLRQEAEEIALSLPSYFPEEDRLNKKRSKLLTDDDFIDDSRGKNNNSIIDF